MLAPVLSSVNTLEHFYIKHEIRSKYGSNFQLPVKTNHDVPSFSSFFFQVKSPEPNYLLTLACVQIEIRFHLRRSSCCEQSFSPKINFKLSNFRIKCINLQPFSKVIIIDD